MTDNYRGHDTVTKDLDRVLDVYSRVDEDVSVDPPKLIEDVSVAAPELIEKYMRHIIACEGISFVSHMDEHDVGFTVEETRQLRTMAKRLGCNHENG